MDDLIEALKVLLKYDNPVYPTWCDLGVLHVCVHPSKVDAEDKEVLVGLGFSACGEDFQSYRFGSE